ncbi:hypothetical protein RHSIM_Rhsim04G0240400 [Rhododendron simsii]|uniref:Transmembrane protein n=1 Tax=Rhododendron simsii TaxID=118357 RepID=A0A834LTG5_RHOSS|nr:hypothetical protein RHSIM_Rhsim04G0240400 [Rhododendron simsii]
MRAHFLKIPPVVKSFANLKSSHLEREREMKELQTPKNDQHPHANRRSKSTASFTKKTQQISKKCLDPAFSSVSDDVAELSSTSETSDDHLLVQSAESSILSPSPVISPSPETVALYNLSPMMSTVTGEEDEPNSFSVSHSGFAESKGNDDIVPMEADMVVNHLKLARTKLMNSTDLDVSSRKLLDALIKTVIEEYDGFQEEKDQFAELVTMKRRVVFVCVVLWILVVSVIFLFRSCGGRSSFGEPLPT